jgi:hypothetical protein
LHVDAKSPPSLHEAAADLARRLPTVHVVDSVLCSWGGWSLVQATLRMIGAALSLPTPWRHFCLLSERHMPLQPPAAIANALQDGVSYSDAVPLPAMDADHRRDLLHRFVREWRELPGVGMFSTGTRELSQALIDGVRLGSQWLVLARAACEQLWSVRDDEALWAPFSNSLVPDETALISVLRGSRLGADLEFRKTGMTFVAWPHLGGGPDSGFTDETVRGARARGHLFIRKRPARLPPFAASLLATFPDRPDLPTLQPAQPPAEDARARALGDALAATLRKRFPGIAVALAPPGEGPACCIDVSVPGQSRALSVHLLSHDLGTCKLLLAWRRPFDGPLAPISLGGCEATIIGARLPGLTLAREVHLPELPDHGFVVGEPAAIAAQLATALTVARDLSVLVPASKDHARTAFV